MSLKTNSSLACFMKLASFSTSDGIYDSFMIPRMKNPASWYLGKGILANSTSDLYAKSSFSLLDIKKIINFIILCLEKSVLNSGYLFILICNFSKTLSDEYSHVDNENVSRSCWFVWK